MKLLPFFPGFVYVLSLLLYFSFSQSGLASGSNRPADAEIRAEEKDSLEFFISQVQRQVRQLERRHRDLATPRKVKGRIEDVLTGAEIDKFYVRETRQKINALKKVATEDTDKLNDLKVKIEGLLTKAAEYEAGINTAIIDARKQHDDCETPAGGKEQFKRALEMLGNVNEQLYEVTNLVDEVRGILRRIDVSNESLAMIYHTQHWWSDWEESYIQDYDFLNNLYEDRHVVETEVRDLNTQVAKDVDFVNDQLSYYKDLFPSKIVELMSLKKRLETLRIEEQQYEHVYRFLNDRLGELPAQLINRSSRNYSGNDSVDPLALSEFQIEFTKREVFDRLKEDMEGIRLRSMELVVNHRYLVNGCKPAQSSSDEGNDVRQNETEPDERSNQEPGPFVQRNQSIQGAWAVTATLVSSSSGSTVKGTTKKIEFIISEKGNQFDWAFLFGNGNITVSGKTPLLDKRSCRIKERNEYTAMRYTDYRDIDIEIVDGRLTGTLTYEHRDADQGSFTEKWNLSANIP